MLLDKIKPYHIILYSGSPRRRDLLKSIGIQFELFNGYEIDESYSPDLHGEEIPLYLAKKKSHTFPRDLKNKEILITADTIVYFNGEVMQKPDSDEDAKEILSKIRCNSHIVYTGVCIRSIDKISEFIVATEVKFGNLTDEEIDFYVREYKPFDKAGAYGIQEWIGFIGVEEIQGSYFNVMGLPIHTLYRELENFIL